MWACCIMSCTPSHMIIQHLVLTLLVHRLRLQRDANEPHVNVQSLLTGYVNFTPTYRHLSLHHCHPLCHRREPHHYHY